MGVGLRFFTTEIIRRLRGVEYRLREPQPVMQRAAIILQEGIRTNFREGGRPDSWSLSRRAIEDEGQTLIDTMRLMNSITGKGYRDRAVVGTNVVYAAAHNYGIDKRVSQNVRAHTRRISQAFGKAVKPRKVQVKPFTRNLRMQIKARPFMVVHDDEWSEINTLFGNFIVRGK